MTRLTKTALATLLAAGALTSPAQARTVYVGGTEQGAVISSQGPVTTFAALGTDTLGAFAGRNQTTLADAGALTFRGKVTNFYANGCLRATITLAAGAPNADGSVPVNGAAKVTGGSMRYRHARGRLVFTGTQFADGRFRMDYSGIVVF
jgi:hypothetical protein